MSELFFKSSQEKSLGYFRFFTKLAEVFIFIFIFIFFV